MHANLQQIAGILRRAVHVHGTSLTPGQYEWPTWPLRSMSISVSGNAGGALLGIPLVQARYIPCHGCNEAKPSTATTRRAMLIIPLIFTRPFTNSTSRQTHALNSPEENGRSPLPPSTFRVMASVQRVSASSTITTQRARFSLFPSDRYAHQKLAQFAKARPQPACTDPPTWPRHHGRGRSF